MNASCYILSSYPSSYASLVKQNISQSDFLNEKKKRKIANIMFKVRLQAVAVQHAALLKNEFSLCMFFSNTF